MFSQQQEQEHTMYSSHRQMNIDKHAVKQLSFADSIQSGLNQYAKKVGNENGLSVVQIQQVQQQIFYLHQSMQQKIATQTNLKKHQLQRKIINKVSKSGMLTLYDKDIPTIHNVTDASLLNTVHKSLIKAVKDHTGDNLLTYVKNNQTKKFIPQDRSYIGFVDGTTSTAKLQTIHLINQSKTHGMSADISKIELEKKLLNKEDQQRTHIIQKAKSNMKKFATHTQEKILKKTWENFETLIGMISLITLSGILFAGSSILQTIGALVGRAVASIAGLVLRGALTGLKAMGRFFMSFFESSGGAVEPEPLRIEEFPEEVKGELPEENFEEALEKRLGQPDLVEQNNQLQHRLNNVAKEAQTLAINMATIQQVQSHTEQALSNTSQHEIVENTTQHLLHDAFQDSGMNDDELDYITDLIQGRANQIIGQSSEGDQNLFTEIANEDVGDHTQEYLTFLNTLGRQMLNDTEEQFIEHSSVVNAMGELSHQLNEGVSFEESLRFVPENFHPDVGVQGEPFVDRFGNQIGVQPNLVTPNFQFHNPITPASNLMLNQF